MIYHRNRNNLRITIHKTAPAALLVVLMAFSGCNSDTPSNSANAAPPRHNSTSLYNPMVDAAPGDERPSVPSIDDVSPAQADGNGMTGTVIPEAGAGRR